MTRTRRIAGSAALSLASQVAAMAVGLWLTRFVLDRLGQHDYGLWLIILQALGWLTLTDLGVVALLPRQTAFATGARAAPGDLPRVTGEAARLAVFALAFPLRRFGAVLQGLQDLVFLGWLQFTGWAIGTAITVAGLLAGLGMHALVVSWAALQLGPPLAAWLRLKSRYPAALPAALPPLPWSEARRYMASALWVSLGQLSTALVSGADVLIIGVLMGPAAVVPYVVTLKLVTVIGNLPYTVAHTAGPALSQMRAGAPREDLRRATTALTQAVLAASGAVACVVLAVNEGFVGWWVGADRYAGTAVTVLGVLLMLVRHYGVTVVYSIYSFGHERRLALVGIVEGVVSVAVSLVLVKLLGPVGAVIGGLVAGALCTLPLTLPTLAEDTDTTLGALARGLLPFVARVLLALAAAAALALLWRPRGVAALALAALAAAGLYAAVIVPVALRPPLREYLDQIVGAVRGFFARPAPPPVPPAVSPTA